ncbi:uncharacterized protein LOC119409638 [Nematolebias whitei]|uniref:uncharacterized protein LOC119409638 n=1 Tax=Nematolebias whitei TaxID=451745 RepID=UPI00189C1475|nr:uncharacterized protein LOC119409638 [Nematolebias whitei]
MHCKAGAEGRSLTALTDLRAQRVQSTGMSVTEEQQRSSGTEASTAPSRMDTPSRSSHRILLLQMWCCLLTLSLVVMATLLISIKSRPVQVSVLDLRSVDGPSWQDHLSCDSCSLLLRNNSIYCSRTGPAPYFIYAQVVFMKGGQGGSVRLSRTSSSLGRDQKLVEASAPAGGSVMVVKVIKLRGGDRVSLEVRGEAQNDDTFWGAFQLH